MNKIYDFLAFIYFFGLLALAVFIFPEEFKTATRSHPYLMGFIKVSLLATFGEYLKKRLSTGKWTFEGIKLFIIRFFVWGVFGLWFTTIFPIFSFGLDECVNKDLWPQGNFLWIAFSKSLWINILGCFGWTMMLTHEYLNYCIENSKLMSTVKFSYDLNKEIWFGKIPGTVIYFWLPAHTITFALPGVWRILMAATLSVILGFLLTVKSEKK